VGVRPLLLAAILLLAAAPGASAHWLAPVAGDVSRGFDLGADPFEGGRHRGADFTAAPGARVRAPCAGRVEVAGRVGTSGRVVTLLCGRWRVSVMPLARIEVRRGSHAARGDRLGTAARAVGAHRGIHLGVRRDGDRFGYVDPVRLLARDRVAPPPAIGPPPRASRGPRSLPRVDAPPSPRAHAAASSPGSSPAPAPAGTGVAPWPVWAGLVVLLSGALGCGGARRARARRAALPRAPAQQVASPP
jgi:Peptidase family M23